MHYACLEYAIKLHLSDILGPKKVSNIFLFFYSCNFTRYLRLFISSKCECLEDFVEISESKFDFKTFLLHFLGKTFAMFAHSTTNNGTIYTLSLILINDIF